MEKFYHKAFLFSSAIPNTFVIFSHLLTKIIEVYTISCYNHTNESLVLVAGDKL